MHEIPDVHAVLILDALKGTRRRAADFGDTRMEAFKFLDPGVGDEVHLLNITPAEDVADEVTLGWITKLRALHELRRGKALEVETLSKLHRIRRWLERLHHHGPLELAAARTARHLREQLKRTLRGAEVRQLER